MPEDLIAALDEITAFAKKFEPLDGHFIIEQCGARKRGRHVINGQRVYVPAKDFDRVRKGCQAGDIIRLLRKIRELVQELERHE